jgi:hypothetical protein
MRKRKKMRTERLLLGIMSAATNIHNQGLDSDGVEVKREPSAISSNGDSELVGEELSMTIFDHFPNVAPSRLKAARNIALLCARYTFHFYRPISFSVHL